MYECISLRARVEGGGQSTGSQGQTAPSLYRRVCIINNTRTSTAVDTIHICRAPTVMHELTRSHRNATALYKQQYVYRSNSLLIVARRDINQPINHITINHNKSVARFRGGIAQKHYDVRSIINRSPAFTYTAVYQTAKRHTADTRRIFVLILNGQTGISHPVQLRLARRRRGQQHQNTRHK